MVSLLTSLLAFALYSGDAYAQQGTAVLVGTVGDVSSSKPVPNTVVTLVSPSMLGEQLVVTDEAGAYRIPGLPPGSYVLRLEAEGFKPYSRDAIELRADATIRVNAALLPEALQSKEVVVVARAPTVDVGSSSTGLNISSDFTRRIPLSAPGGKGSAVRSFESIAEIVPQATADTYGVSINGASSPENSYLIDGLSVNNGAFGVIGTPLSIEFIKEVSVITGGYLPEYGHASGGILNAITKSGSNELQSSVFMNYAPGGLEGNRKSLKRQGQTIVTDPSLDYMGDLGGDVSGPILKDKLWFYAGFDWSRTKYSLDRSLQQSLFDDAGEPLLDANGNQQTRYIPGTRRGYTAQQDALQGLGKLDWAVNRRNRVTLSVNGNWQLPGKDGRYGIDPVTGLPNVGPDSTLSGQLNGPTSALANRFQNSSTNTLLKWSSELDGKRLMLDTTLGVHHLTSGRLPSDGSSVGSSSGLAGLSNTWWIRNTPGPHSITDFERVPAGACLAPEGNPDAVSCPVSDYHTGGPDYMSDQTINRYQGRSVLSWMFEGLGHHVFKTGVDMELMTYENIKGYSGGRSFVEADDGSYFIDGRQYGYLTGPDQAVVLDSIHNKSKSVMLGGFAQDSWSVMDLITVNLGMRYDAQLLYAGDGTLAMTLPKQWSPRAGVIYDFTGEGRSKIYANYARYYQSVPLDVMDRTATGEPLVYSAHDAGTCSPLDPSQQQNECLADENRLAAFDPPNSLYGVAGAGRTPVDPKIKAPSSDEFVLGSEYEVVRDGRLGISYTKRWLNSTIEDMSRDEAQTYFLGNPGYGIAKDFPKAERKYDAVTMYFQKAFAQGWLAQASYTVSYLRGNYAGLFRAEDQQLDPFMNSDFDLRSLTVNRKGSLPGDHRHSFKLFGAKDFKLPGKSVITPGGSFRAISGAPSNYLGAHPLYGQDQVYILPRGEGERLPWNYSTDVRVAYSFAFDKKRVLSLTFDIFNVFNFQSETVRDQRYTNSAVTPVRSGGLDQVKTADGADFDKAAANPNFGKAIGYQAPRIFRFGLRATF